MTEAGHRSRTRQGAWGAAGVLGLLIGAGVVLLAMLGRMQHVPVLFPDELLYGGMADSLAAGHGATFRGADPGLFSIFPYVLWAAWDLGSSVPESYGFAKVLTAALFSVSLVPLWLALKDPLGPWVALLPCAALLAGPWSQDSSKLLTESLALPLVTSAIALLWWGLRSDRRSRIKVLAAFVFAASAVLVRMQLAVLIPAFALAIAIDALVRIPAQRRSRILRFAPELSIVAFASVAGAIFVSASDGDNLGVYNSVHGFGIGIDALQRTIEYAALFPVYAMLLPALVFFALICSRAAWRDPAVGSLLAILAPLAAILTAVSGWFVAGAETTVVERYLVYLIPWLLALPLLGLKVLNAGRVLIGTAVVAVLVALPVTVNVVTAAETFEGGRHLFGSFFGLLGTSSPAITVLIAATVGLLYAVVVARPAAPAHVDDEPFSAGQWIERSFSAMRARIGEMSSPRLTASLFVLLLLLAIPVSEWRWGRMASIADKQIAALPADLDWVDDAVGSHRSVALVSFGGEIAGVPLIYTDFFNRSVNRVFAQSPAQLVAMPGICLFDISNTGELIAHNACAKPPAAVLTFGSATRVSVRDAAVSVQKPGIGTLSAADPTTSDEYSPSDQDEKSIALQSLIAEPCQPNGQCADNLSVNLWLTEPAELSVTFAGPGEEGYSVSVAGRDHEIAADGLTTVPVEVPAGEQVINLGLGWAATAGSPKLESVKLDGEEIYAAAG